MEKMTFLKKFVRDTHIEGERYSSYSTALRNARMIMGRDPVNGANEFHILEGKNGHLPPYSFIGVVNYLILLEMIGNIFKVPDTNASGSAINKALMNYTELNEKDRYTIDALRNALVHSYSLVNIPSNKKYISNSQHKFTLDSFSDIPLISYPSSSWDGSFTDKSDESITTVQTTKLIDLIEKIVTDVQTRIIEYDSEDLAIGLEELKARYTILM